MGSAQAVLPRYCRAESRYTLSTGSPPVCTPRELAAWGVVKGLVECVAALIGPFVVDTEFRLIIINPGSVGQR